MMDALPAGFANELVKIGSATRLLQTLGLAGGAAYLLGGRNKKEKEVADFERQKLMRARPRPRQINQRDVKPAKMKLQGAIAKTGSPNRNLKILAGLGAGALLAKAHKEGLPDMRGDMGPNSIRAGRAAVRRSAQKDAERRERERKRKQREYEWNNPLADELSKTSGQNLKIFGGITAGVLLSKALKDPAIQKQLGLYDFAPVRAKRINRQAEFERKYREESRQRDKARRAKWKKERKDQPSGKWEPYPKKP